MPTIDTTISFVAKAKVKHKNVYDYSEVSYIHSSSPIVVVCRKHGSFVLSPSSHLSGKGCPQCKVDHNQQLRIVYRDKIVEQSKARFGDIFDYTQFVYVKKKKRATFICKLHNLSFLQYIESHLSGMVGCPQCLRDQRLERRHTTEKFIAQAIAVHNHLYDYSRTEYVDSATAVIITCFKHGDFKQTPDQHLYGSKCQRCAAEGKLLGLDEFLQRAYKVHRDMYDYTQVEYVNSHTRVRIICPEHGIFEQTPFSHYYGKGQGCPQCHTSKGEKDIQRILQQHKIAYEAQKRFVNCKNHRMLRFDFFLPTFSICIEYNGRQHYELIPHFGGIKDFKARLENDDIKKRFCLDHNMHLLIIKYDEDIGQRLKTIIG